MIFQTLILCECAHMHTQVYKGGDIGVPWRGTRSENQVKWRQRILLRGKSASKEKRIIWKTNTLGNFNFALGLVVFSFDPLDYGFGLVPGSPPGAIIGFLHPVAREFYLKLKPDHVRSQVKASFIGSQLLLDKSTSCLASSQYPLHLPKLYLALSCFWPLHLLLPLLEITTDPPAISSPILFNLLLRNLFLESPLHLPPSKYSRWSSSILQL